MPPTLFVTHPDFLLHDTGLNHPERPDRLRAILTQLEKSDLKLLRAEPKPADLKWIEKVHTLDYIKLVRQTCANGRGELDAGDTVVCQDSYHAALLAAGAGILAVDAVATGKARNAFCAVRPPGHHALPDSAMGFCLFGNIAIAARYAQEKYGFKKILIVDWDVHHGNGTQDIFYQDDSVLFFSIHQFPFWPGSGAETERGAGKGRGFTINTPLPAGSGGSDYIRVFHETLIPAADRFEPDLVLISAGFDAHADDPLAEMNVQSNEFKSLTEIVMNVAHRHSKDRVVSFLEGGYHLPALAESVHIHLSALSTHLL